ncbi:WD repeat-containing protein jip5 [Xylographa opegraphella]|nr:WD repeat-containing protein jip5 [Xylographa opegraphella]
MFDTICTLPLPSDLFAQAIHPTSPLLAVGLASGHVQTYRLPPIPTGPPTRSSPKHGRGTIETSWRTKRHKGSCRSLAFSSDGEALFSAGTDGIVKAARAETGRVEVKIGVPLVRSEIDAPCLLHALSPQTLVLATDSGALYLYDLRADPKSSGVAVGSRPQATFRPHDDYVSSLTPLPPTVASTSGFPKQWVTTGGTTLAVTDLRRGVLAKSEDQEEELLSGVYVTGLVSKRGRNGGDKVLVGGGSGVLTLWDKGAWDDQGGRIIVDGGKESLDVLARVPEGVGEGSCVAVGMGDGRVKIVRVGANKVVGELRHDEVEGVVGLGFEVGGRMVSGGGPLVKVWQESADVVGDEEEEDEGVDRVGTKRGTGSDSDEDSEDDEESSEEEEEQERKRRKKRKRANGKDRGGGKDLMQFTGID